MDSRGTKKERLLSQAAELYPKILLLNVYHTYNGRKHVQSLLNPADVFGRRA
jgi:hypothetical protein